MDCQLVPDGRGARQQERRSDARRRASLRVLVLDPADALDQPYPAWIVNQSKGGVCLCLNRSLAIDQGSILLIQAAVALGSFPWIEVEVRNRRLQYLQQALGCRFVHGEGWERVLSCG